MKYWFVFLLTLMCAFSGNLVSETKATYEFSECLQDKIYIERENLVITDNEIIVIIGTELFSANSVFKDNTGFFIFAKDARARLCPNGHQRECPMCNGCRAFCRFRCLCGWHGNVEK